MGTEWGLREDLVKQHDFLNLLVLPVISLISTFSTVTGDQGASVAVIRSLLCYMAFDSAYIALRPKSVPR